MRKVSIIDQSRWKDFSCENSGPWRDFQRSLEQNNLKIVKLAERPEILINLNHKLLSNYLKLLSTKKANRILVLFEARVNSPINFNRIIRRFYGRIFSPSPLWCRDGNCVIFNWPQTDFTEVSILEKRDSRKSSVVMIAADRYSSVKGELYTLRRSLAHTDSFNIDVFGRNWNQALLKKRISYIKSLVKQLIAGNLSLAVPKMMSKSIEKKRFLGYTQNKFETYAQYKYALVIENSADYFSEKLIDAIIGGTIPIYVGAKLSDFGIPEDVAFQAEASTASIEEAYFYLEKSPEMQKAIIEAGKRFLHSEQYMKCRNHRSLMDLAEKIARYLNE